MRLANEPDAGRPRHSFYPVVITTGAGDFGAETPTIGFPFIIESVTLYSEISVGVALSWNLLIDNTPFGGSRSPFDGVPVIRSDSNDTSFDPRRAFHHLRYPIALRPRFRWNTPGYRIRLAVNVTSNPWRVGALLDLSEAPA